MRNLGEQIPANFIGGQGRRKGLTADDTSYIEYQHCQLPIIHQSKNTNVICSLPLTVEQYAESAVVETCVSMHGRGHI